MNLQECADVFGRAAAYAGNIKPILTDFSHHMKGSINQNFLSGGRPVAWAPVEPHPGHRSVLIDTGALYDSSTAFPDGDTDVILVAGGGGQPHAKAPTLQYGANYAAKQRGGVFVSRRTRKNVTRVAVTIPARPYLLFQDADLELLGKALPEFVFERAVSNVPRVAIF